MYRYIYVYLHVQICRYLRIYIYIYLHLHTYLHMYVYIYMIYMYIYLYTCICVCIYIYIYVHIHNVYSHGWPLRNSHIKKLVLKFWCTPRYMCTTTLCTHRYIGWRNLGWAEISVFLMVIYGCKAAKDLWWHTCPGFPCKLDPPCGGGRDFFSRK